MNINLKIINLNKISRKSMGMHNNMCFFMEHLTSFLIIISLIFRSHLHGHEKHMLLCLFTSILYSKIKIEIDTNNDELLKTI
jgi:hypothetical protein